MFLTSNNKAEINGRFKKIKYLIRSFWMERKEVRDPLTCSVHLKQLFFKFYFNIFRNYFQNVMIFGMCTYLSLLS